MKIEVLLWNKTILRWFSLQTLLYSSNKQRWEQETELLHNILCVFVVSVTISNIKLEDIIKNNYNNSNSNNSGFYF